MGPSEMSEEIFTAQLSHTWPLLQLPPRPGNTGVDTTAMSDPESGARRSSEHVQYLHKTFGTHTIQNTFGININIVCSTSLQLSTFLVEHFLNITCNCTQSVQNTFCRCMRSVQPLYLAVSSKHINGVLTLIDIKQRDRNWQTRECVWVGGGYWGIGICVLRRTSN